MRLSKKIVSITLGMGLLVGATTSSMADFKDGLYFYYKGDHTAAFIEWRGLAIKGDADSQYNLGVMYSQGEAVLKNNTKAVGWLKMASKQGHAKADEELGRLYCVMGKKTLLGMVGSMQSVFCNQ
jgi:TPR repeat protein